MWWYSRPGLAVRRGEERIAGDALAACGVPTALRIRPPGTLEGGDICLASPELALIGHSRRTNLHGANQLAAFLAAAGFAAIHVVPLLPGTLHLDMVLAMLDRNLAAVSESQTPARVRTLLASHGIRTVALPDEEVIAGMALNLLALGPRQVMLPSGNPVSRRRLEQQGVDCIEVDVSELMKGGGALHCMTAVLQRDFIKQVNGRGVDDDAKN